VTEVQRTYDRRALDRLLEGWDVVERTVVERAGDRVWKRVEDSTGDGVALVVARAAAG